MSHDHGSGRAAPHDHPPCDCGHAAGRHDHAHFERAEVDNSEWDGPAAMGKCNASSSPGSCYSAICAGKKSGPPDQQSSWALPHHKTAGGPPNAAGVQAALGRLNQTQGLQNASAARKHLEAHMAAIQKSTGKSKDAEPNGHDHSHDDPEHDHSHEGEHENGSLEFVDIVEEAEPRPIPVRDIFRAVYPGVELREASGDTSAGGGNVMEGHFAVFNKWTKIDSIFEGEFMESIAPGAFAKTLKENRDNIRVLFNHGRDPSVGNKPLGKIEDLGEDKVGAFYSVPLLEASYVNDIVPGLREGLYGASFRFQVTKEEVTDEPKRSAHNPDGIQERVIKECKVMEFGPVTFPAYAEATAGMRSITDEMVLQQALANPERVRYLFEDSKVESAQALGADAGEPVERAEEPHSDDASRDEAPELTVIKNPNRRRLTR